MRYNIILFVLLVSCVDPKIKMVLDTPKTEKDFVKLFRSFNREDLTSICYIGTGSLFNEKFKKQTVIYSVNGPKGLEIDIAYLKNWEYVVKKNVKIPFYEKVEGLEKTIPIIFLVWLNLSDEDYHIYDNQQINIRMYVDNQTIASQFSDIERDLFVKLRGKVPIKVK